MAFFVNGNATWTTTSGTKTLAAITVAQGELLVVVVGNTGSTANPTLTDDGAGGTYTQIASALLNASADKMSMWVRDNLIAVGGTITVTMTPGATTGGGLRSWRIGGMSRAGLQAIVQSAKQENGASGGTPAPAFATATLTQNMIIGAIVNGTNPATMTPPSGFTEHGDAGYATPAAGLEGCDVNSGQTLTTVTWGSTSGSNFGAIVLELDASAQQVIGSDLPLIQNVNHLSPI